MKTALPPLLAAVLETKNYIVGEANAPSGLYRRDGSGWTHAGWSNLRCTAIAVDPADPQTLFLASGNGVLRSRDGGATWRVTTDWRVAEVLDVALDPFARTSVFAASAYGVWHSPDSGDTWAALPAPASFPDATFAAALVPDRQREGRLVVATENGLFESRDGGHVWTPLGPRVAVRALAQNPSRPERWLAGTAGLGVLLSLDDGATWATREEGRTIYAVAFDPAGPDRLAAVGFETGLLLSTDAGATWQRRPLGLPTVTLHAVAFDPDIAGRLWLGTVGEGVFCSDDLGATCRDAGLPETTVTAFAFP